MFAIRSYDEKIACKSIEHGTDVFHRAYADGDTYYHVQMPDGGCYDIEYLCNSDFFKELVPVHVRNQQLVPDYHLYDEDDVSLMDMEYLDAHTAFICQNVNEYTLAVAHVVLKYTEKDVYFSDDFVYKFIEPTPRLHVTAALPEVEGALVMTGPKGRMYYLKSDTALDRSDIMAFHSLFVPQWFMGGKDPSKLRYVDFLTPDASKGIVSLLNVCNRMETYFSKWGLRLIITGDHISKYDVRRLRQYFRLNAVPADMNEENTLILRSNVCLQLSWRFQEIDPQLRLDIFSEKLRSDMEAYREAVFHGRKALGVLIRGTDYHTVGFSGLKTMASPAEMIPLLHEWIERDGYEMIFLATEDKDVLNEMIAEFGGMVCAIGQERHTVEEVRRTTTLDALERKLYSAEDYDDRVMETTVNYMYALYMLAHCDSLVVNGKSNGVDIAKSFNADKYTHYYQFGA